MTKKDSKLDHTFPKDIKRTPIEELESFTKFGNDFRKLRHNPETNRYLYERRKPDGSLVCYEVVIPKRQKGVLAYPSSDDWGSKGFTVMAGERHADEFVEFLLTSTDVSPEARRRFRNSL